MKFRVGQIVECTESLGSLVKGRKYKISKANYMVDEDEYVGVEIDGRFTRGWLPSRFNPVVSINGEEVTITHEQFDDIVELVKPKEPKEPEIPMFGTGDSCRNKLELKDYGDGTVDVMINGRFGVGFQKKGSIVRYEAVTPNGIKTDEEGRLIIK